MKYCLFVVYDRVAGTYAAPVPFINTACAQRWFRSSGVSSDYADPTDFELYQIGEYDTNSGVVTAFDKPVFVEKGVINEA